ncbi:hypothetical protein GJ496_008700 [Pomphorhynchus laevis]|nr:hypothetical protein GJ496_008700 [Pomphorhynchus laevis]
MTNFLKSTFSNFFQSALGGNQGNRRGSYSNYRQNKQNEDDEFDDFINRKVEIGSYNLLVKKKIGSGGFSSVYMAQRTTASTTGNAVADQKLYAIKRMIVDSNEQRERVAKECRIWKACTSSKDSSVYIVKFILCAELNEQTRSNTEYLLLSEYCEYGRLSDYIKTDQSTFKFTTVQSIHILYQQASALNYLHKKQSPSIVHRDVKLENFLLTVSSNRIILKLCDFGSATDKQLQPNREWNALYRGLVEDEFQSVTTPAYRPPELLNTYDEGLIGCPMDMWALGCCFYQEALSMPHPFLDCSKLKILNADYKLPNTCDSVICDIIRQLLNVDPLKRITASGLLQLLFIKDIISDCFDGSNLKFILSPSRPPPIDQNAIINLTSKISLLTSASRPLIKPSCLLINDIKLSYIWLKRKLPMDVCFALQNQYLSVLLHSPVFGHTVIAAASIFKSVNLCKQSELFIHYLYNLVDDHSSLQLELPSSARRYLDYVFDSPLHCKRMLIKQLEILPGNDPFSASVYQIDNVSGKEKSIYQSSVSCDWQRDVNCVVYGDVLIKIVSAERIAEMQFNTMFIPVTECEICFESCDFDSHPFGDPWIESLIIDFMFTIEDAVDTDVIANTISVVDLIVNDERELKTIKQSIARVASQQSKFFTEAIINRSNYTLSSSVVDQNRRQQHSKSKSNSSKIINISSSIFDSSDLLTEFNDHNANSKFTNTNQPQAMATETQYESKATTSNKVNAINNDLLLNVDECVTSPLIDFEGSGDDNGRSSRKFDQNDILPEYLFTSYLNQFSREQHSDDATRGSNNPIDKLDKDGTTKSTFYSSDDDQRSDLSSHKTTQKNQYPKEDLFNDLFDTQQKQKISLLDLQKLKLEREQSEPAAFRKIREWSLASNNDITSLLSRLHTVLPMETSWQPISLTSNSKSGDIKKCYRKALLLVHPDKNTAKNLPNEQNEACRLIFMELSDSWSRFQTTAHF